MTHSYTDFHKCIENYRAHFDKIEASLEKGVYSIGGEFYKGTWKVQGDDLLYKIYEILGSDKPIYKVKPKDYFTREEIIHLHMNTEDFEHAGYVLLDVRNSLFESVYMRKRSQSARRKAAKVIQLNSYLK